MSWFSIEINHSVHIVSATPSDELAQIFERLNAMSQAQTQLAAALEAKTEQIIKAIAEVSTATGELQAQIAALDTITPELQAAFDRLASTVQTLDDLNPDAAPN